jgi:hypothetical protein
MPYPSTPTCAGTAQHAHVLSERRPSRSKRPTPVLRTAGFLTRSGGDTTAQSCAANAEHLGPTRAIGLAAEILLALRKTAECSGDR